MFFVQQRRSKVKHIPLTVSVVLAAFLLCVSLAAPCYSLTDNSLYSQAQQAEEEERFDDAIDLYKRSAIQEGRAYVPANTKLMYLLIKLHKFDEAEQICSDLYQQTHDANYKIVLGDIYRISGNHYAAQTQYEEILSANPDNGAVLVALGQSYEATSSLERARECYTRAAQKGGSSADKAKKLLEAMSGPTVKTSSGSSIDVDTAVGFWMPSKMPLKVCLEHEGNGSDYGCPFVLHAIQDWNSAMHGVISMTTVNDPDQADIVVTCVTHIPDMPVLGITRPKFFKDKNVIIEHATIQIATNVDAYGDTLPPQSSATAQLYAARDKMLSDVSLHELGHALGLTHSNKRDDIMANGIFGLASADVMTSRGLTANDLGRLRNIYAARDKVIAAVLEQIKKEKAAKAKQTAASVTAEELGDISFQDDQHPDAAETASVGGGASVATAKSSASKLATSANPHPGHSSVFQTVMFNLRCGDFESCLKDLKVVLTKDPQNVQAHYLMAVALVNLRRYEEAAKEYKDVLRIQPKGPLASLATAGLSKIEH